MTKIEVLNESVVEGLIVKLPDTQLDRKVYLEVKKALELIGGKWKGGKTMGFVFTSDPTALLAEIAGGAKRNLKKEFQYFATPEALANELVQYADIKHHDTVLEPSVGQGSILKAIHGVVDTKVGVYELMDVNRMILINKFPEYSYELEGFDFMQSTSKPKYNKIVANPPFAKNQDIDHVHKMYDKLLEGGRLVSVMSKHWQLSTNRKETEFRLWLENVDAEVIELPAGTFKESGTNISAVIVIINK